MTIQNERYLVNAQGERVAVVLDLAAYRKMVEAVEELHDLRAFDAAKQSGEKPIPIQQALADIEGKRRPARRRAR